MKGSYCTLDFCNTFLSIAIKYLAFTLHERKKSKEVSVITTGHLFEIVVYVMSLILSLH